MQQKLGHEAGLGLRLWGTRCLSWGMRLGSGRSRCGEGGRRRGGDGFYLAFLNRARVEVYSGPKGGSTTIAMGLEEEWQLRTLLFRARLGRQCSRG